MIFRVFHILFLATKNRQSRVYFVRREDTGTHWHKYYHLMLITRFITPPIFQNDKSGGRSLGVSSGFSIGPPEEGEKNANETVHFHAGFLSGIEIAGFPLCRFCFSTALLFDQSKARNGLLRP